MFINYLDISNISCLRLLLKCIRFEDSDDKPLFFKLKYSFHDNSISLYAFFYQLFSCVIEITYFPHVVAYRSPQSP